MCCWQHKAHAVCCTFFSLISAIILLFLGELIKNQPEFHVTQFPNGTEEPAKRLFGAAGMYMGTMVISLAFWVRHNNAEKAAERRRGGGRPATGGGLASLDGLGLDTPFGGDAMQNVPAVRRRQQAQQKKRKKKKKKQKGRLVRGDGSQKGLQMWSSNTGVKLLDDNDRRDSTDDLMRI